MARVCEYCAKRTTVGNQVTRRGLAKAKGGVGRKVTGRSKRRFLANIQKVRALVDGVAKRVKVCAKCLKSGKVAKRGKIARD
jgi:large subunit ribosomal protein L28